MPGSSAFRKFDLSDLAVQYDQLSRSAKSPSGCRRVLVSGYVAVRARAPRSRTRIKVAGAIFWPEALALAVGGATLAAYALTGVLRRQHSPRELTLSRHSLIFTTPGRPNVAMSWDSPRLRLRIYDYRAYPVVWRNGTPRTIDFLFSTKGTEGPISHEAMSRNPEGIPGPGSHRIRMGRRTTTTWPHADHCHFPSCELTPLANQSLWTDWTDAPQTQLYLIGLSTGPRLSTHVCPLTKNRWTSEKPPPCPLPEGFRCLSTLPSHRLSR